jgi:hypothetical protein
MKISLVGPSYTAASVVAAAQQTMNLYPETIAVSDEPRKQIFVGRPGMKLFATLTPSFIRTLWSGGGRLFVVHANVLSEVHSDGTYTSSSNTVAQGTQDPDPAQIFSNGHQLMIVSGGQVYCDNGDGPVPVRFSVSGTASTTGTNDQVTRLTGPSFDGPTMTGKTLRLDGLFYHIDGVVTADVMLVTPNPKASAESVWSVGAGALLDGVTGGFLDGYFIVNRVPKPQTPDDPGRQFAISALFDGTLWDALDFGVKEGYPDYIRSIHCDHEELWLFGTETTEIWMNVGTTLVGGVASFPFQRITGAFIHDGSVATYAPCTVGPYTCWLGGTPAGQTIAYRAMAFQPERISTFAQEQNWNAPGFRVWDAVSYAYRDGGHLFWVINFWQQQQTWVYDMTENLWHERAMYNTATSQFLRYQPWYHTFIPEWGTGGKHIVGDPNTGKLYEMSLDYTDDDGLPIQYQRAFPHLLNEDRNLFHHRFELYMETGLTPQMLVGLDWSDDRGHTFKALAPFHTSGGAGQLSARIVWRRLGRSRDRVYRVGVQGTGKVALTDAFLEVTPGTS